MKKLILLTLSLLPFYLSNSYASCVGPFCWDDRGASISGVAFPGTFGGSSTPMTATIQDTQVTLSSTTSNAYLSTELSVPFALSDSSHKVKITVSGQLEESDAANTGYVTLFRDNTDLGQADGNGFIQVYGSGAEIVTAGNAGFTFMDSPGDTTSHTYRVKIKSDDNTHQVTWNTFPGMTSIVAEEVL